jgi:hypothetical protein
LTAIDELGLTSRGAGADNIRNLTGSPAAGIDPQEQYDTRPLCRALHHYILNHRELYGLADERAGDGKHLPAAPARPLSGTSWPPDHRGHDQPGFLNSSNAIAVVAVTSGRRGGATGRCSAG